MRVARIGGVVVSLHWTFGVLMVAFGLAGLLGQALIVFGIVFLHEIAHAWVASRQGLDVKEIILFPFGGVLRVNGLFEASPGGILRIALAGPMMNGLLFGLGTILVILAQWQDPDMSLFLQTNLTIGILNLLPALPLDGGRICAVGLTRYFGGVVVVRVGTWLSRGCGLFLLGWAAYLGMQGVFDLTGLVLAGFLLLNPDRDHPNHTLVAIRDLRVKERKMHTAGILPVAMQAVSIETPLLGLVLNHRPRCYTVYAVVDPKGRLLYWGSEHEVVETLIRCGIQASIRDLGNQTLTPENGTGVFEKGVVQ